MFGRVGARLGLSSAASRPGLEGIEENNAEIESGAALKREALSHTKMKRLCRRLKIPLWQAVGLMECIWHLTARQAHRGDIGKLSNEDIAIGIEYGEDEDILIEALVDCGWFERHPVHRLVVHDWQDHADDALNMRMARAREFFWSGAFPKTTRLGSWEREKADDFYNSVRTESEIVHTTSAHSVSTACTPPSPALPSPPPPSIKPEAVHTHSRGELPEEKIACVSSRGPVAADLNGHTSQRFAEFFDRYPRRQRKDAACRQWLSMVDTDSEGAVFACLERYLASDEVARGVVANPDKWLYEQHGEHWEGRWPIRVEPQRKLSVTERAQKLWEAENAK